MSARTCEIEGCEGKHLARGMCQRHYKMSRYHNEPEYREAERRRARESYERNKGRFRGNNKWYRIKSRYGITREEYEAILERQSGACAICLEPHSRLYIDHNHETGEVRGLLCPKCNTHLHSVEREGWLMRALEYLGVSA